MAIAKMKQKIVLGIYFFLTCSMQWFLISPLIAEEMGSEYWMVHPSAIEKCLDHERTLAIDYSMHPYYLRMDLDGDDEMEYIVSVLGNSGWERAGLMVCRETGAKTIYRGIADRDVSAEEKDRIGKMWGIVKDAVLIEGRTPEETMNSTVSKTFSWPLSNLFKYRIAKCCYGQGKYKGGAISIHGG